MPQSIRDWIDRYLEYVSNLSYYQAFNSLQHNRGLFVGLPDLVWNCTGLRYAHLSTLKIENIIFASPPLFLAPAGLSNTLYRAPELASISDNLYPSVVGFCKSYAALTVHFLQLDFQTLRRARSPEENALRDLVSLPYLSTLAGLLRTSRRDDLVVGRRDEVVEATMIANCFQEYHKKQGGSLTLLHKFMLLHVQLVPHFPKAADNLASISGMASVLLRECDRLLQDPGLPANAAEQIRERVRIGHQFFEKASATLSTVIDKHVTSLGIESTAQQISSLSDIVHVTLRVDHPDSVKMLAEHRKKHPMIASELTPEVFAMEWRFNMFRRLIMSSQMQLRVMAVTNLCSELVSCWKRFGEYGEQAIYHRSVLHFVADFLVDTGLVAYLLGPTCHPEITIESGNIIGFLAVTKTYKTEHSDLLWQTITTTQDPRIAEALIRMTGRIANLQTSDALAYLCKKLLSLPVEGFSPVMREFCDSIFKQLIKFGQLERQPLGSTPFAVCLRLLKESSVFGPRSPVAYPDIHSFASDRLTELLAKSGLEGAARQEVYDSCLHDIESKAPTALGSLAALNIIGRLNAVREVQTLTVERGLTALLVDELENAIRVGREAGYIPVISGAPNTPRRDMISTIVLHSPASITTDLGSRLWSMMVGRDAACQDDRDASWKILNACLKRVRQGNSFLEICFEQYLPDLPADCFCEGLLDFVRGTIFPLVNDESNLLLYDDESQDKGALEQLWRLILSAPPQTIERQAIATLVSDIYIDSKSILSLPHHRARKVHLSLVSRCLRQLS